MAKISQIKFIEEGQYEFKIAFMFGDVCLYTSPLLRTTTLEEIRKIIKDVIIDYQAKRAQSNFDNLKTQLEGKEVDV